MDIISKDERKKIIDAAIGRIPFDLVIKNSKLVNVFTGEIYEAEIGIKSGYISHIKANPDEIIENNEDEMKGKEYYDAKGSYIIPGLIDSHIHIESTMLTPKRFSEIVVPKGTTTVIADPHEIANVYGIAGVEYMHNSSEHLPLRCLFLAPPCIPAVPNIENAGAEFHEKEIEEMMKLKRVIGIAEVMDYIGVINNDERIVEILDYANEKNLYITGHSPELSGRELSAYLCSGAKTDHEIRKEVEAREKYRNGMYVDTREGSISKNIKNIYKGVKDFKYLEKITLCSDDLEVETILKEGHMNNIVKKAIKYGMSPIDAIRSATINTAKEIGINRIGAIAPGYVGDLLIVDSLEEVDPRAVFYQGNLIAENGKLLKKIEEKKLDIEKINSINIKNLKEEDLLIKTPIKNGTLQVKTIEYKTKASAMTILGKEYLEVKEGKLNIEKEKDLMYCAVINRYGKENISVGLVKNFGNLKGAIASSVSHDCHNITVVYDNPKNALIAIEELKKKGGGMSIAWNEKIECILPLPVAGLMSNVSGEILAENVNMMKGKLREFGLIEMENPLLRITTLALPVIPDVKMTDMGLVDVKSQKFISIFN